MTHIKTTKSDLLDAILSPENRVISLVGHWGVGKTFLWDQVRKENSGQLKAIKPNYAYVSLFGMSNIDEVRSALFSQFASITVEDASRGEKTKNALAPYLERVQQLASKAEGLWKLGAAGVGAAIELMKVNCIHDMLVCLDDFERADSSLRSIQILGLINELTAIRNCKVLLILNDEKLGNEVEDFREYTERVIDKVVRFEPTHTHALQVAVPDSATRALLAPYIAQLGCENIRVIRKMAATLEEIKRRTGLTIDDKTPGVISSVCLFTFCNLVRDDGVPTVDAIVKVDYVSIFEDAEAEQDKTRTFLRAQNWHEVDKCDRLIAALVSRGISNWEELKQEIIGHSVEVATGRMEQEVRDLWGQWGKRFISDVESKAFAQRVVDVLMRNMVVINAREIDDACSLLRTILNDSSADALLDHWKLVHKDNERAFDLRGLEVFGRLKDDAFREYIDAQSAIFQAPSNSIAETLVNCFSHRSWGGDSFKELVLATPSQYAESLRGSKDAKLAVNGWLLLVNAEPINSESIAIYKAGKAALELLAIESSISKVIAESALRQVRLEVRQMAGLEPNRSAEQKADGAAE